MPGISRLQEASSRFSDDDSNIGNNSQVGFARAKATSSRIAPSLRLRSQVQWQWIGLQFVIEFDPLGTEVTNRPGTPKGSPTEEAGVVDTEKELCWIHSRPLSSPNVQPFTNALPCTGDPAITAPRAWSKKAPHLLLGQGLEAQPLCFVQLLLGGLLCFRKAQKTRGLLWCLMVWESTIGPRKKAGLG